jgi:hypothetical protein
MRRRHWATYGALQPTGKTLECCGSSTGSAGPACGVNVRFVPKSDQRRSLVPLLVMRDAVEH